jgi:hypothetical protein
VQLQQLVQFQQEQLLELAQQQELQQRALELQQVHLLA